MNKVYQYTTTILEKHLDVFGHVNNAVYVQLFEEARWDYMTRNGVGLDYIGQQQIGPVLLNLSIVYKKELTNRQSILIESIFLGQKNRLVMQMEQTMYSADRQVASTLKIDVGLMDFNTRKLISPTPDWITGLGG